MTGRLLDLALGFPAGWWFDRQVPVAVNLRATDLDDERSRTAPHRRRAWAGTGSPPGH